MYNDREELLKALKENYSHNEIMKILYKLLLNQETKKSLSTTWSPFGFLITYLNPPTSVDLVRLHIWLSDMRPKQVPDWPIHFHSWTVHSRILLGSITNNIYKVEPNQNSDYQLYQAKYTNKNSSLIESIGIRTSCQLLISETYYPGQNYFVKPREYHATQAAEDILCATLVLMTDNTNHIPCTVGKVGYRDKYLYDRTMLDDSLQIKMIGELTLKLSHTISL